MMLGRSWKGRIAAITVVVFLIGMLPAQLGAQSAQKVVEVVITGNSNVNKEAISGVIDLKAGSDYSEQAVEKDKAEILALGYFSAVSSRTEEVQGGLRVVFDVVENPMVKDIKVVGSGPIPPEKVLEVMRIKAGRVLNTSSLNLDIEAIQQLYKDQGYWGTFITEDIGLDRDTGVLTIPVLVPTVESIDIVGNKKTKDNVFFREMKTKPGSILNVKVLHEDMTRIYNLDILEDIQTPQLETGSEVGKVRVVMPVTEKKTGQLSLGLGYSSRQKLVGRAEMTETNFRGKAQGLNVLWETGVSSGSGGRSSYELGFHEPWLDKHNTSFTANIHNKVVYRFASGLLGSSSTIGDDSYYERHKGGSLGLSRPVSAKTRAYVTLRSDDVSINNFTSALNIDNYQNYQNVFNEGLIRSVALKAVNDTRDIIMNPAIGGYHSLSLELGSTDGNILNPVIDPENPSDIIEEKNPLKGNFSKITVDLRRYFSKEGKRENLNDKRRTLAFRVQAGLANGVLPFSEQYFVGGAESLRGYREDRFWGDKMFIASAEYRVPIANSLVGVAFVDFGDAWGTGGQLNDLTQHVNFDPSIGTGIGIRVNTPIGNLRLDYGFGSEGGRTHFSIGHAY